MSVRGVTQIRALALYYCDVTGSSAGAREFVRSGMFAEFLGRARTIPAGAVGAEEASSSAFRASVARGRDPHVRATYANGNAKTVGLKNLSALECERQCEALANEKGKPGSKPMKGRHFTKRPSVQGRWTPFTFGSGAPYDSGEAAA